MKYSLDLDEPLEGEVRRIALGRLTDAAELLRARPEGLDAAIHDTRRHIKQCRALYRLIASEAEDFQKTENRRLGDIGRQLSHMRDAKALIEATDYLKREVPTKSNGMLMDRLSKRLDQRRQDAAIRSEEARIAIESAEHALVAAADAAASLCLPNSIRKSSACLARGWETASRKARAAVDAASEDHEEAFHDLRKRSQDRWMQAALMRGLWPTAMLAIERQGKMLSDMLGHAQDLTILIEAVAASDDLVSDAVESEAVRDVVLSQQKVLQGECRTFAKSYFTKSKPRDGRMIRQLLRER